MINKIKSKNENFREIKIQLKQSPRQSLIELDNILSNVQDKKAFVFLMDAYETEKELTREILENFIEKTMEFNEGVVSILEGMENNKFNLSETFNAVFNPKNLKSLLVASVVLGLLLSIAFNENVAIRVINYVVPSQNDHTGDKK